MARIAYNFVNFYQIIVFITVTVVVASNPDYYFSNAGGALDTHVQVHRLLKRQAVNSSSKTPQQQTIEDNRSNRQFGVSPFLNIKDVQNGEINNKSPPLEPPNANITKKVLEKNLGENGHGIQKNYSSTTVAPPTVTNTVQSQSESSTFNNQSSEDDEISISNFSDDKVNAAFNKSLENHDINETKTDTHVYYNSTFIVDEEAGMHYWVNMNDDGDVKINPLLSKSHRRAATIKLSFDFPFYGHLVPNVTIATGGFLYTGEYVHSWLAATQYIAPLMANFDTSISNDSFIKYKDNGTAFTVEWERVSLQDKPEDGEFTFQTTLLQNGDIVFVYKLVPLVVEDIKDDHHPVKVGLSDAYIIDRTIFFVRRKTIYEYHRVNFNKEDIKNWTVIYLKALPTCLDSKDCNTCLSKKIDNFQCTWCPAINRCSNGMDRQRQYWLTKGCDRKQLTSESQCSLISTTEQPEYDERHNFYYGPKSSDPNDFDHSLNISATQDNTINNGGLGNDDSRNLDRTRQAEVLDGTSNTFSDTIQASRISHNSSIDETDVSMSASGILTILFAIAAIGAIGVWITYAYRNPHTTSGQILIRYRPSQWSWKRGEARYTAATIHM